MKKLLSCYYLLAFVFTSTLSAQEFSISEPDKDLSSSSSYEILGKSKGNILVYVQNNNSHAIWVYNSEMKLMNKNTLNLSTEKNILNADCMPISDGYCLFYQYRKKGIVYAMAQRIDTDGNPAGSPKQLDTTIAENSLPNKVYQMIYSDDKQYIMAVKVFNKNEKKSIITTILFNKDLELLEKKINAIDTYDAKDAIGEFQLDNDGDMVCLKTTELPGSDYASKVVLLQKKNKVDTLSEAEVLPDGVFLEDAKIKIDNLNGNYLVLAFFTQQKRGDIQGLFYYAWNKWSGKLKQTAKINFNEELRQEANPDVKSRIAFNEFYLRNIVLKKDGSFIIAAENVFSSSRGNAFNNRWDYGVGGLGYGNYGYGFGNSFFPWSRYNGFGNITRFYAENVVIMSVSLSGELEWHNMVLKSQSDDNTDSYLGYGLMNSGSQLIFIFNNQEKRATTLSLQSITPGGQLSRFPSLRNLPEGYDFMPRQSKQVGLKQIIIPCMYRNYICFAKADM